MARREIQALRIIERDLTVEKSITQGLKIEKAVNTYGIELVENTIAGLIMITAQVFNVGHNITDDQALLLAGDLIATHDQENIEDIILMLKTIRTSGVKLYGKFDAETLFQEFDKMMDQKIDAREQRWIKQKEDYVFASERAGSDSKTFRELHHQARVEYLKHKTK